MFAGLPLRPFGSCADSGLSVLPLAFSSPSGNIGTGSNFFWGDGLFGDRLFGDGFFGDGLFLAFGFDLSGVLGSSRCAFRLALSSYICCLALCSLSCSRCLICYSCCLALFSACLACSSSAFIISLLCFLLPCTLYLINCTLCPIYKTLCSMLNLLNLCSRLCMVLCSLLCKSLFLLEQC